VFFPIFINDQQNILDIILSEDNKKMLGIYLYVTKKSGIHESILKLQNNLFEIDETDLDSIEKLFNKAQISIVKSTGIRISLLRLFKNESIDLINEYCRNIEGISHYDFITHFLELFQKLFERKIFQIFPTPNSYVFLNNLLHWMNGFTLSKIFKFIYGIFPYFNTVILFNAEKQPLILLLQKSGTKEKNRKLEIEIKDLNELQIKNERLNSKKILKILKKELKTENIYLFNQDDIISLLLNLFDLEIPIQISNLKIVMQKFLFGVRNFDQHWQKYPRPLAYNNLFRFFIRIFGLNINLRKLSHWAIPETIFNIIESEFGLNARILIIFTSIKKNKSIKKDYIQKSFDSAILLQIENRKIIDIIPLKKNDLISEDKINTIEFIKNRISNIYGFVSVALNIDKLLLIKILEFLSSKPSKFKLLSIFKSFRMLKSNYYFGVYPEKSSFKFIKNRNFIVFLKKLLPILIDKHEF
jgi:hypothetical protein